MFLTSALYPQLLPAGVAPGFFARRSAARQSCDTANRANHVRPDVCSVTICRPSWAASPGYFGLQRLVAIAGADTVDVQRQGKPFLCQ